MKNKLMLGLTAALFAGYASAALIDAVGVTGHEGIATGNGSILSLIDKQKMQDQGFPDDPTKWTTDAKEWSAYWDPNMLVGAANSKVGWVVLDLGSSITNLGKMLLWNNPGSKGTQTFNLYFAETPTVTAPPISMTPDDYDFASGGWSQLGAGHTLSEGASDTREAPLDGAYDLSSIASARYIGIEMMSNHGDATLVGLSEVIFVTPPPPPPATDEFVNAGFETGTFDGWTVTAESSSIRAANDQFKTVGEENLYHAQIEDNTGNGGELRVESIGTIQSNLQYTVSIESIATRDNQWHKLSVFYLDDDGVTEHIIGMHTGEEEEWAFVTRSVSFPTQEGPHIGKKIVLRFHCSHKPAYVDNARIMIATIPPPTELEELVMDLDLVDVLLEDGSPNFTTYNYKDFRYTQIGENTTPLGNAGMATPEFATLFSDDRDYNFYDNNMDVRLEDGESASLFITLNDTLARVGFALNRNIFVLGGDMTGMNPFVTPDYVAHIAKVSDEVFEKEMIIISRVGDTITWYACGRKGSYELPGLSSSPRLNLFARGSCVMYQLRKGTLTEESKALLEGYVDAPHSPLGRPNLPFPDYWSINYRPVVDTLGTDLNSPLSEEEMATMVDLVSSYPAFGLGVSYSSLADLPGMYIPAKVFLITRSKKVLDEMLRISDRAILSRNGFAVNGIHYGALSDVNADGTVNTRHKEDPITPALATHTNPYINTFDNTRAVGDEDDPAMESEVETDRYYFNENHEYVNKYMITSSQGGNSRSIIPAMTAYCISLHPELWDRKAPSDPMNLGETYGERGRRYIKELALYYADFRDINMIWYKVNPLYDTFSEPRTHFYPGTSTEIPTHAVNRFSSSMSGAGFAGNAAEAFGDTESMEAIDSCARKVITTWFNCYHYYAPGHNDKYLNEPANWYRTFTYTAHDTNQEDRGYDTNTPPGEGFPRSEDRGHVNFTLNGFQLLYDSHRYEDIMTTHAMTELARTFNEVVLPSYNEWWVLPRARSVDEYVPSEGFNYQYSAMLMLGDFNAELKEKLIKCLAEHDGADHNQRAMNLVNLAMMRAESFDQIPEGIVDEEAAAFALFLYNDWMDLYPELEALTNLLDDAENGGIGDGALNLAEYALGGNPLSNDTASIFPVGNIETGVGGNWMNYSYNQREDAIARGLSYTVYSGTSLLGDGITSEVPMFNLSPPTNGFSTATYRIPTDVEDQQFMKLEIRLD